MHSPTSPGMGKYSKNHLTFGRKQEALIIAKVTQNLKTSTAFVWQKEIRFRSRRQNAHIERQFQKPDAKKHPRCSLGHGDRRRNPQVFGSQHDRELDDFVELQAKRMRVLDRLLAVCYRIHHPHISTDHRGKGACT